GNEILGVLAFFSRARRTPDPDLLQMVEAVGTQMGQFMERKRAEEALAERGRFAVLTAEIGLALTRRHTLPSLLQHCTEALVRHLEAAGARIWTLHEAENVLELQAAAGLDMPCAGLRDRVPVGKFTVGLIAQVRKPHVTHKAAGDPLLADPEWAKQEGLKT